MKTFSKKQNYGVRIDDRWSADLIDMIKFSVFNEVYKYMLAVIDVFFFSKYLWMLKR